VTDATSSIHERLAQAELALADLKAWADFYKPRLDSQEKYKALERRLGGEGPACKEIARKLRIFADHLDKIADDPSVWPKVYGCNIEEGDLLSNSFIERVSVVLSDPWPG